MGASDRRIGDDKAETSTEATGEVGQAAATKRSGARVVGRDRHRPLRRPYWYFRYQEDGRQRKIYHDPEGKLSENRRTIRGRD
jgi:hypothetical protein